MQQHSRTCTTPPQHPPSTRSGVQMKNSSVQISEDSYDSDYQAETDHSKDYPEKTLVGKRECTPCKECIRGKASRNGHCAVFAVISVLAVTLLSCLAFGLSLRLQSTHSQLQSLSGEFDRVQQLNQVRLDQLEKRLQSAEDRLTVAELAEEGEKEKEEDDEEEEEEEEEEEGRLLWGTEGKSMSDSRATFGFQKPAGLYKEENDQGTLLKGSGRASDVRGGTDLLQELFLSRVKRSTGENANAGKRKKKRSNGDRHCKKTSKCFNNLKKGKVRGKTCKKVAACIANMVPATPPVKSPQALISPFVPKAVHFMSNFWDGGLRQQRFGKDTPLKFLSSADWMKDMYRSESDQPIKSSGDGGFEVTEPGLYLIYSSVMFHDVKPRMSTAVVVNGNKLFKCMDSVDYIDTDLPAGSNQAKYKTCTMTGVTHLGKGARLEVQNLYDNTEIDLSTDASYFGAILLAPGEIKDNL